MEKNKVVSAGNITKIYNKYNECIAVAMKKQKFIKHEELH